MYKLMGDCSGFKGANSSSHTWLYMYGWATLKKKENASVTYVLFIFIYLLKYVFWLNLKRESRDYVSFHLLHVLEVKSRIIIGVCTEVYNHRTPGRLLQEKEWNTVRDCKATQSSKHPVNYIICSHTHTYTHT